MLRKRIIFTLLYNDGFFVQSRNFRLQKVGDINWLEKFYKFNKIAFSLDELIILNVSKKDKNLDAFCETVSRLVEGTFIPVAAGGGIRSMQDAEKLFKSGADKIVLNSALYNDEVLIENLVKRYGSQSIVASIDYKTIDGKHEVYIADGSEKIPLRFDDFLLKIKNLQIGEIYLNSIDRDGTGFGYDFSLIETTNSLVTKPLIIAGGAGNSKHFEEALKYNEISAVATANLFNFVGNGLPKAREILISNGENLANWDDNK
jgi:cyclase